MSSPFRPGNQTSSFCLNQQSAGGRVFHDVTAAARDLWGKIAGSISQPIPGGALAAPRFEHLTTQPSAFITTGSNPQNGQGRGDTSIMQPDDSAGCRGREEANSVRYLSEWFGQVTRYLLNLHHPISRQVTAKANERLDLS
jgi:hypothetical protein